MATSQNSKFNWTIIINNAQTTRQIQVKAVGKLQRMVKIKCCQGCWKTFTLRYSWWYLRMNCQSFEIWSYVIHENVIHTYASTHKFHFWESILSK